MDDLAFRTRPAPSVILAVEPWERFWPEAKPLMLAHKLELKQSDPREPLIPDHQQIDKLEAMGGLMVLTARAQSELAGYLIWHLAPNLETIGIRIGLMGPWYVKPEHRQAGVGLALWRESKRLLRLKEVSLLIAHFPAEGPGAELGKLFAREGGKVIGTEVKLWLKDQP